MSEGSSDDTEPQTPLKYPQVQEDDGDHTPSFSSPPASPSLSLHSPVRSPFSPLRHEISLHDDRASDSSLPDRHELVHDPSGVMDDSRDALIQRLNDLAARLSAGEEAYGENVSIIHSKVDELERMLAPSLVYEPRRHKRSRSPLSMDSNESDWEYGQQGPSYHKLHVLKADVPRVELKDAEIQAEPQLVPTYPNRQERKRDNSGNAKHVLAEAQKVQEALGIVVSNLRARQEEQEHIHDLLITRAERAAQRIIYLEGRVKALEHERNEDEMEVLNLQIQLKAIEVQCLTFVPKDADPDLLESIETWKSEWSALKRKKTLKGQEELSLSSSPVPRGFRRPISRSQTAG